MNYTLNEERLALVHKHCEAHKAHWPKASAPDYVVNRLDDKPTLTAAECKRLDSLNRHPVGLDEWFPAFVDVGDFYELARRGYLTKIEGPWNHTEFRYPPN